MPAVLNVNTTVRGYHVYRTVWNPTIGEGFVVLHQPGNDHDHHAMGVYRVDEPGLIVGHIARENSRISHYFTMHDGKITREVTGPRRYCREVGGMHVTVFWNSEKCIVCQGMQFQNFVLMIISEQ